MELHIWDTGEGSPKRNMEIDFALPSILKQMQRDKSHLLVRFYTWKNASISLGFHQKRQVFNELKMQFEKIELVRRPTGGRAVFHAGGLAELTYSVAMTLSKSREEHFDDIRKAVMTGLQHLGVKVEMLNCKHGMVRQYKRTNPVCFTANTKQELLIQNKKITGAAQRILGNILLHQGNVAFETNQFRMSRFFQKEVINENEIRKSETSVFDLTEKKHSYQKIIEAFTIGFETVFKIKKV